MSNYSPIVNFAAKDALLTGDPAKKILGTEVTAELTAIATMSTSKEDTANKGIAGGYAPLSGSIKLLDTYLTSNVPLINSLNTWTNAQTISTATPTISFVETDAGANQGRWSIDINSEIMRFRLRDDANSTNTSFITVNRTANVCDSIDFTTTLATFSGALETSGVIQLGSPGDTTLARDSAGAISVEGHRITTNDQAFTISAVWNFTSNPTLNGLNIGYMEVPQNIQNGNYTTVLADDGKHIYHASGAGAGHTYNIAANASVAYPVGTILTFVNASASSVTLHVNSDTLTWSPFGTTGDRTLAQHAVVTALKHTTTGWYLTGTGIS